MAHPHDRGLFLPPASAASLADRDLLDQGHRARTSRRQLFRWFGWSAIGALVGQWTFGYMSFFTSKRLGVFGGTIVAGVVGDYQVGDVKVFREGKCYVVRVPEGFPI
jgi:hypothetical protein